MAKAPWHAVAALVDQVRRGLYDYVRHQNHAVSREEAAEAIDISRNLAAFHLDKLVDAGLLRARYEAPVDQPRGRGRAPKVYEPSGEGFAVAVPERRYDLVGEILAQAVAEAPHDAGAVALRVARERGEQLGEQLGATLRVQPSGSACHGMVAVTAALGELGFEPAGEGLGKVILRNCPFHDLAVRQPALVCGINHAFVQGLLSGLAADDATAHLVPRSDACCVELSDASTAD